MHQRGVPFIYPRALRFAVALLLCTRGDPERILISPVPGRRLSRLDTLVTEREVCGDPRPFRSFSYYTYILGAHI